MHDTNTGPTQASGLRAGHTPTASAFSVDVRALSVRELIAELAATEALLRQSLSKQDRAPTMRRQALIVGELRRRRRRHRRESHSPGPAVARGAVATE